MIEDKSSSTDRNHYCVLDINRVFDRVLHIGDAVEFSDETSDLIKGCRERRWCGVSYPGWTDDIGDIKNVTEFELGHRYEWWFNESL